jgi:integrase
MDHWKKGETDLVNHLRINEKIVRDTVPGGRAFQVFDSEVRGFSLRVQRTGTKGFALDYWHGGRKRRIAIGRWPDWSVVAARDRAKELRRDIDAGLDPLSDRTAAREAPKIPELIDRYLREHAAHLAPTNASDQQSMLKKLIEPHWKHRLVEEIEPIDVERVLDIIATGRARPAKSTAKSRGKRKLQPARPTPIRANRAGEVLRKMFNLAVAWKMRKDNPAAAFRRRMETERERFLSMDEISRLGDALQNAEDQRASSIIRMCMLTGARLGEVRTASFEQFNLELGTWAKPAANTKQRRIHRVPISSETAALVRQRRMIVPDGCEWLFPGDALGADGALKDQPVREIRRFWTNIQKAAGLQDLRIHDLRHTFASLLVSGGASLEMIGKLLGHSQMRTTQRYAHLMDSPLRAGVDAVANIMKSRPRLVVGGA